MTAAITTGELWPYVSYFSGNSGDNGEGTMNIPFDSLAPSKSGNRITNTPGYYDYGMLGMFASSGPAPTSTTTAAPPLLFVSSPSQLNQGAVNSQHQFLKGISVGTVGGVPILPPGGVTFQQLAGFGNFTVNQAEGKNDPINPGGNGKQLANTPRWTAALGWSGG